jgi:hypothetical protein
MFRKEKKVCTAESDAGRAIVAAELAMALQRSGDREFSSVRSTDEGKLPIF